MKYTIVIFLIVYFFILLGLFKTYGYLERIEFSKELAIDCQKNDYIVLDDMEFFCQKMIDNRN